MIPASMLAMASGFDGLHAPWAWLATVLRIIEWVLIAYSGYVIFVPAAGFLTRRERRRFLPSKRFAVVIPAHNERLVVGNLVDCCQGQAYPRELFDIYVVADNCSDDTASVARAHGARVLERRSEERHGKGHALTEAFARLAAAPEAYDAVVVFDADNLVRPNFLSIMNAELMAGREIVQGRIDIKNPDDSWVAATFGMSFWATSRFWFLAKHNLGLSAALSGRGMCITMHALQEVGWRATSLTEDLEFSARALLAGFKVYWSHDAVVYDEMPLTLWQSWGQRVRWSQGQAQVAACYLPRLIWAGIRNRSLVQLEGGMALLQPFYLMLSTVAFGAAPWLGPLSPTTLVGAGATFWIAAAVVNYLLPVFAVLYEREPLRPLRYLLLYPVFLYTWVPLTWTGVLSARRRTWTHVVHTRAIAYAELAQARGAG